MDAQLHRSTEHAHAHAVLHRCGMTLLPSHSASETSVKMIHIIVWPHPIVPHIVSGVNLSLHVLRRTACVLSPVSWSRSSLLSSRAVIAICVWSLLSRTPPPAARRARICNGRSNAAIPKDHVEMPARRASSFSLSLSIFCCLSTRATTAPHMDRLVVCLCCLLESERASYRWLCELEMLAKLLLCWSVGEPFSFVCP